MHRMWQYKKSCNDIRLNTHVLHEVLLSVILMLSTFGTIKSEMIVGLGTAKVSIASCNDVSCRDPPRVDLTDNA
jgi:membrane-bound lytic murein transglycosylase B